MKDFVALVGGRWAAVLEVVAKRVANTGDSEEKE